jgi:hypothetical protein
LYSGWDDGSSYVGADEPPFDEPVKGKPHWQTANCLGSPPPLHPYICIQLDGAQVLAGGSPNGRGELLLAFPTNRSMCYALETVDPNGDLVLTRGPYDVFQSTMTVHRGLRGANGVAVFTFFKFVSEPGGLAYDAGCLDEDGIFGVGVVAGSSLKFGDVAEAILNDPTSYYVTLRTQAFPDGAVRGQLSPVV